MELLNPADMARVESSLLQTPWVCDCAALTRSESAGSSILLAYVVPNGRFSAGRLKARLREGLPPRLIPDAFVPIAFVPLDKSGQVDKAALLSVPMLDSDLAHAWEKRLRRMSPTLKEVAVSVSEVAEPSPNLHLSDLVEGWETPQSNDPLPQTRSLPASAPGCASNALSLSQGGPAVNTGEVRLLGQAILNSALQVPGKGIVCLDADGSERHLSYRFILEEARRVWGGLRKKGIGRHDRLLLQLHRPEDFLAAFWACQLGGIVAVPLASAAPDEGQGRAANQLLQAWAMLGAPALLTSRDMLGNRNLQPVALDSFTIEECRQCPAQQEEPQGDCDDLAMLLLTSGSTGKPKGVRLSHRNMLSCVAGSIQVNGYCCTDVSLNWLPLNHVGALARTIRDAYLGCNQIQAPARLVLQDPLLWLDWIERYRVTISWAPNFAYGLIVERQEKARSRPRDLSSLRSLWTAGESISPKTMQAFLRLLSPFGLSAGSLHTSWGMTEANMATFSHTYLRDAELNGCQIPEAGRPIPGLSMRIVDSQDRIVAEGTAGRLQIAGPACSSGYWDSDLTDEAFTSDGWLNTGDLGVLHQGRLTITGREKDVTIINGLNYSNREIESALGRVEGLDPSCTAACAVRRPDSDTDQLAIFFHPLEGGNVRRLADEIRRAVLGRFGLNPDYLIPVEPSTLSRTELGKIQKSRLSERFEAGEFADPLKQLDILTGNANTVPDWFYRKAWRPRKVSESTVEWSDTSLIFVDGSGLGSSLLDRLKAMGRPCVAAEMGTRFIRLRPSRFRLDPACPDHFRRLLQSQELSQEPVARILYLWGLDDERQSARPQSLDKALPPSLAGLLHLGQALAKERADARRPPVRLLVAAFGSQGVLADDPVDSWKGLSIGLAKTLSNEVPWLDCRHLDLPPGLPDGLVPLLLKEFQALCPEREVAYRGGERLIARLAKADLAEEGRSPLPLRPKGLYLISGGLGGVGSRLAGFLLERFQAHLLLIGTTILPPRQAWPRHQNEARPLAQRIRACLSLEQWGGKFDYQPIDVCEETRLTQALERAESHWQRPLEGIFHVAGVAHGKLLQDTGAHELQQLLRPKVQGAWVLHRIALRRPKCLFVSFSSLSGLLGAANAGGPAAAHGFLEGMVHLQRKSPIRGYCFCWSLWDGIGISRKLEGRDALLASGYRALSPSQGWNSLLAGLQRSPSQLLVGMDDSSSHLRRVLESRSPQAQWLKAEIPDSVEPALLGRLKALRVADRFGTPSRCFFQRVSSKPPQPLSRRQVREDQSGSELPGEAVQALAAIFADVLEVDRVGPHDNFFTLGGTSVQAVQLAARLSEELGRRLPMAELFSNPSPAALWEAVAGGQEQESGLPGNERARIRRERRRARHARRGKLEG